MPERIYLFGSTGRGETHPDSDLDFCVVVRDDTPVETRESGEFSYRRRDIGWPLDVLVFTRSYFDGHSRTPGSLPATVLREGTLIYASELAAV